MQPSRQAFGNKRMGQTMSSITQKKLKEYLLYDECSGVFTWKVRPNSRAAPGSTAGFIDSGGYRRIGVLGEIHHAHRLAFLYKEGCLPKSQVDHINHDRADNRWSNLRHATPLDNNRNSSIDPRNTSGVTGVSWNKVMCKWEARIKHNGVRLGLGCYDSIDDARKARKEAELKYGYHENHGALAHG